MNRRLILVTGAAIALVLLAGAVIVTTPRDPVLPQVAIAYGLEKGDLSYIDSAYRGVWHAQEDMAFDKHEFYSLDYDAVSALLQRGGAEKPRLVITISYAFTDTTKRLARENPDVRFVGLDQQGSDLPNLRMCEVTAYGGSYLAGVLAAKASACRHIGIIYGTRSALLESFGQGFRDGARAADPVVAIEEEYIEETSVLGFNKPQKAQVIARSMYGNGTDVIYTVAGYSGSGVIAEAKHAPGRYVIGVDSDQTDLGPRVVLASVVKHMDQAVYDSIAMHLNDTFTGGDRVIGLGEGATELVFNPRFASFEPDVLVWEGKAREAEARFLQGV